MQTYIVERGDTLYGISKQFGVSVQDIKNANNITSDSITIGQVLKIPTTESTLLYIVQPGDSLYSIATRYNTTVQNLIELNNLKGNIISVGQEIRIPIGQQENYTTYIVKKGDNLYSIANRYNTTVDKIKTLNNLQTNLLSIGQFLKILTTTQSNGNYITYTVRRGDSLYKIANAYNTTVDDLIKLNNLPSTLLSIGQTLKIKQSTNPNLPESGEIKECFGKGYQEPIYQTYTVQRGDSLYTIAKRYNTTVDNLIMLNNLKTNNLSIGQILKIREVTR